MLNIQELPSKRMRIWVLQPSNSSSMWFHDMSLGYLLGTLIDTVKMNIHNLRVNYVFFTEKTLRTFQKELESYPEDYFLFFMEDSFHSADYAVDFIEEILSTMKQKGIKKHVIVFSHKTESHEAKDMMKRYENIDIFVHDDIEYFFHALFAEKKDFQSIPNLLYRENEEILSSIENNIVDTDISTYIHGAYHNKYYTYFPRSKDWNINMLDEDDSSKSIYYEMHQPKHVLQGDLRRAHEKVMLSTGRGCKYKCSYCYRGAKYSKVRQIPLEVIEKDLAYLYSLGYSDVLFYDDCFLTTNADRIEDMLYLMKKYPFKYHISTRFEMCNEGILEKLSVIDLGSVQIGLQSISKSANKTSKRGFLAEKFEKVIMELKNNGTSVSIDTILGLPDDSPSGFLSTIKYAISLKPSSIVTNTLYLNPRTEIYRNKEGYGIETHEARGTLHYYKARRIKSSMNFKANEIELCRKFLIECKKKIPSIQFVIR